MPPATGSTSDLFTFEEIKRIVAGWIVVWVLGHYLCWPLWNRHQFWALACRPTPLDRYRRRLARSQVYNFIATCGGLHLLFSCRWDPAELISNFSKEHQILFSMAIGHWSVMIWEELRTASFLSAGIKSGDLDGVENPSDALASAYFWHHLAAIFVFASVLVLPACSGIAMAGLVFELPVLLMTHREFLVYAEKTPAWFLEYDNVDSFWDCLDTLFLAARGGATAVYVYSLVFWRDYLNTLPRNEYFIYHSMAIFFSVLNYFLSMTFLSIWGLDDRKKAMKAEEAAFEEVPGESVVSCDGESAGDVAALGQGGEEKSEVAPATVDETKELAWVADGRIQEKAAENAEAGKVFIEIDGVAYDLTSFLEKHPGGAAVLRKHAGTDASEAFHRVRHSMNAKRMMQQWALGPIKKAARSYRVYEHIEAQLRVYKEGSSLFSAYLLVGLLLPRSSFFVDSAMPSAGPSWGASAVPGLLVVLLGGGSSLVLMFWSTAMLSTGFSMGAQFVGMCVLLHVVALSVARQPLPVDAPDLPTGLEIGAWVIFLLEEVIQRLQGSRDFLGRLLLSFGLVASSWVMRDILTAGSAASGHLISGVVLGVTAVLLCHRAGDGRPTQVVAPEILVGAALSGPYSALCLFYLSSTDPAVSKAVEAWWPTSLLSFFDAEFVAIAAYVAVGMLVNCTHICTDRWAARCLGIMLAGTACLAGGMMSWRWLEWLAFPCLLSVLGDRLTQQHNYMAANDTFRLLHPYQQGTRATWDMVRTLGSEAVWFSALKPMRFIVNHILPEEFHVFALALPAFDFGDNADMGFAAYSCPVAALSTTKGPEHFELTVSHVDMHQEEGAGIEDLYKKLNTMRDAWEEFRTPAKGLLANVVCYFPQMGDSGVTKHVQLSAWQTAEHAEAWHSKSGSSRDTISQHEGSSLRTCGSLKAMLKPHGRIRHQDRCQECSRLVESDTLGEHAPKICRICGGKAFGYPFF